MKQPLHISALILPSIAILLAGCGGSSPSAPATAPTTPPMTPTSAPLASGGATSIYVLETNSSNVNTVLQFSASANGSASPLTTLSLPANIDTGAITTDRSGQVYVGGSLPPPSLYQIEVYASGNSMPVRTIVESNTSPLYHTSMAVDASGSLYVLGADSTNTLQIAVYSSAANGASAPISLIAGPLTQLTNAGDLAIDTPGNIYVANGTSILVFAPGANGNVAPTRVITSSNIGFNAIAVDPGGNIYSDVETLTTSTWSILEFAAGTTGAATPVKTITSSALTFGAGLRVDNAGNIYLINRTLTSIVTSSTSMLGFGPAATGNSTPAVNFTSTAWPVGVYFGTAPYGGFELALK